MTSKTTTRSYKRGWFQRLTPAGWFLLIAGVVLGGLALYAGGTWLGENAGLFQGWLAELSGEAEAEPLATLAPAATAVAAPVITQTYAYPATWATRMVTDTQGYWWPATDDRAAVVAAIEHDYRAAEAALYGEPTLDQVLTTLTDADLAQYLTGWELQTWQKARQDYLRTGQLPLAYTLQPTKSVVLVGSFTPDGGTAFIGVTRTATNVRVQQADGTWQTMTVGEDGLYAGVQVLGVQTIKMQYDQERGQWLISEYLEWIPRPAATS